jgi:hypothetical protein
MPRASPSRRPLDQQAGADEFGRERLDVGPQLGGFDPVHARHAVGRGRALARGHQGAPDVGAEPSRKKLAPDPRCPITTPPSASAVTTSGCGPRRPSASGHDLDGHRSAPRRLRQRSGGTTDQPGSSRPATSFQTPRGPARSRGRRRGRAGRSRPCPGPRGRASARASPRSRRRGRRRVVVQVVRRHERLDARVHRPRTRRAGPGGRAASRSWSAARACRRASATAAGR